ncbi:oxysterol-binding protein-related [Holotrichia oblita]|uniref:Oxysterol-binding protein-related n=1 Tax=Holotrichia oblita TaxID=644536 RepID=A0ACB9TJ03_HOLOL|nr:oxysterol-binding protein-related [Holotrichia oblita]
MCGLRWWGKLFSDGTVLIGGVCVAALYEDEIETDVQLESQGSVIKHLLSQVKIGMDLTKVVLPTFILERRSLLEMYADYFAHPDIFVQIADLKDPKERMVQVVRWYLSSYHAGRKSSVAKKPYNPILGELFYCLWDVPNCESTEGVAPDGPVSWCTCNQLAFVAEQVSHHPPISAFYAEHYNKRITFNAHIYTKSKFLGLSICVYNIGQGVVSVLDYDEEYVVTFPNGYGRSILTVPWIELGGAVSITCKKTGYHCDVEFITKPFYGNKKHRITAEVFGPDDKKAFLSITGEWNGVMEARWGDGGEVEEFINVQHLNVVKKRVQPIIQQQENESRKLWKEVTAGLKFNDIDHATNAKASLEQKQRDEAKYRKDTNTQWETKLFNKEVDDSWTYVKPLRQRLNPSSNT